MSPSEIREMVDERLSMHDMTPEGGCSEDFRKKLKQFIEKYAVTLEITMRALQPHVGELNDEESRILETVAQSISGITSQQLQVFEIIFSSSSPTIFCRSVCYLLSLFSII